MAKPLLRHDVNELRARLRVLRRIDTLDLDPGLLDGRDDRARRPDTITNDQFRVMPRDQVDEVAARSANPEASVLAAAARAAVDPEARRVTLRSPEGRITTQAVVLRDGSGFLFADDLPTLSDDRTYQLWALAGGQKISAGVLGSRPRVVAFKYAPSELAGLAVTAEDIPGVTETNNAPVVLGNVQQA